jgi:hypothetical protein
MTRSKKHPKVCANENCPLPDRAFLAAKPEQTYCSYECRNAGMRKVERPTVQRLRELAGQDRFQHEDGSANLAAIARELTVDHKTLRKWLDQLQIQL